MRTETSDMSRIAEFKVAGMSCTGCADSLTYCLASMNGVAAVEVRFDAARAILTIDDAFDVAKAMAVAAKAGFALTPVTAT